jgi:hypothetical protein
MAFDLGPDLTIHQTRTACRIAAILTAAGVTLDVLGGLDESWWRSTTHIAGGPMANPVSAETRHMVRALLEARAEGTW